MRIEEESMEQRYISFWVKNANVMTLETNNVSIHFLWKKQIDEEKQQGRNPEITAHAQMTEGWEYIKS